MPRYVDGFVLPVPTEKVAASRRRARKAGKIWREQGGKGDRPVTYREWIPHRRPRWRARGRRPSGTAPSGSGSP